MIRVIADDLGPSLSYSRREMRAIVGGRWEDGRDATVILDMQTAQRRYRGGKHCKSVVSGYAVSRVPEAGTELAVVWDKLFPTDEHGDDDREDVQKPPYTVRVRRSGEVVCSCMAGVCLRTETTCRHCDATLYLADAGAFDNQTGGI